MINIDEDMTAKINPIFSYKIMYLIPLYKLFGGQFGVFIKNVNHAGFIYIF